MTQAQTEVPRFRVTTAPGFATGLHMYGPDEEIDWVEPEGWNEKKYGKHFSAYGPSLTFACVNKAAEDLMEKHKEKVKLANQPKPTRDDERFAKMEAMHIEMMTAMLEMQAENRRLREKSEEAEEKKGKR